MGSSRGTLARVERQYDWREVSPGVGVIDAIASYEDTTPANIAENLDPPLGRVIDIDAIDTLIETGTALAVSFTYADYHIQIRGNTVKIACPPTQPDTPIHDT